MNSRNYQYNEWAGPTTSAAPTVTATLSPTWAIGDRYCVIANIVAGMDTSPFDVVLGGLGTASDYDHYISPRDTANDMYCCPMIFSYVVVTGTEAPELYFDSDSAGAGTTARTASIHVFKMLENDQTNADYLAAGSSTTNTTFTDVTGSTVTIARTGTYLILACASVGKGETTANFNIQLAVNGTGYGDQTMRAVSPTHRLPWAHMVKLALTAGDVLTIQHKVTTTGTVSTSYPSIVALWVGDFPNIQEHEDTGNVVAAFGTAGTWVDHTLLEDDYRLAAFESLILSTALYRHGNASGDVSYQTLYDGTTISESRNESVVGSGEATHFSVLRIDPSAGSHTILQQIQHEGVGALAATGSDCATAVLQFSDDLSVEIRGGDIPGGDIQ